MSNQQLKLDEVIRLDTSEEAPAYQMTTAGRQFRLSASAYELLRLSEEGKSATEIAALFSQRSARPVAADAIEEARNKILATLHGERRRTPITFVATMTLMPAWLVQRIAGALTWLYRPAALLLALAAVVAAVIGFATMPPLGSDPLVVAEGLLLFMVVLVAHELGHASACAAFGALPDRIGIGIYVIYPALFSDVTAAWRLRRGQRVLVDLGGSYFQLLITVLLLAAERVTHAPVLRFTCWASLASAALSLNPLLRFDGYWLLADALGVVNLADQRRRVWQTLWHRQRLPWSRAVAAAVGLYAAASVGFAVWLAIHLATMLWTETRALPSTLTTLFLGAHGGPGRLHAAGALLEWLLLAAFPLALGKRLITRKEKS